MHIDPQFIALATFPGAASNVGFKQLLCRLTKTQIYVSYFWRRGIPTAYIVYDTSESFHKHLFVEGGAVIIQLLLGASLLLPLAIRFGTFTHLTSANALHWVQLYLGLSFAFHSVPDMQNAEVLFKANKSNRFIFWRVVLTPLLYCWYVAGVLGYHIASIFNMLLALFLPAGICFMLGR